MYSKNIHINEHAFKAIKDETLKKRGFFDKVKSAINKNYENKPKAGNGIKISVTDVITVEFKYLISANNCEIFLRKERNTSGKISHVIITIIIGDSFNNNFQEISHNNEWMVSILKTAVKLLNNKYTPHIALKIKNYSNKTLTIARRNINNCRRRAESIFE